MVPSLALLSCDSSVSVKKNPDRKKKAFRNVSSFALSPLILSLMVKFKIQNFLGSFLRKSSEKYILAHSKKTPTLRLNISIIFSPQYLQ